MKENEIQRFMQVYGESVGECRKTPIPRHSRRSRLPTLAALVGTSAVLILLSFMLWPQYAAASALRKVGRAIKNARTMETHDSWLLHDGTSAQVHKTYYQDGMWRHENTGTPALRSVWVLRDGLVLIDYERLDHAILDEGGGNDWELQQGSHDALDFVKEAVDSGAVSTPRKIRLEDGDSPGTYRVVMDRDDSYHAVIHVDRSTNLPLRAEVSVDYSNDAGPWIQHFRHYYQFNHPIPPEKFELKSKKPIVDLRVAGPELAAKWSKPMASGAMDVRDASVSADGTVWIVATRKVPVRGQTPSGTVATETLPSEISTNGETAYVRFYDIIPSALIRRSHSHIADGREPVVIGFVPLTRAGKMPTTVVVDFSQRIADWQGLLVPARPKPIPVGKTVPLPLRREAGYTPGYFPGLNLGYFSLQLPIIKAEARAKALEAQERWVEAAEVWMEAADAYRNFVRYAAYKPLQSAAKCYRKAGMVQEAEEAVRQATALKASRVR